MATSQVKNLFHNYEGFTEKFKPKKTTDDCYTPPAVYDAVLNWVKSTYNIGDRPIVRPFYPGGDYEFYDYPEGCVVVDNPPFSIYAKICRFYKARGVDFFLFGPHITLAKDLDVIFIVTDTDITYANGARVNTGFVTNLDYRRRIWICPELRAAIYEAQKTETSAPPKLSWPRNFTSIPLLSAVGGEELELFKDEVIYTDNVGGRKVFGGGFILSDEAVEKIEAAKRARMARKKKQALRAEVEFGARELYLLNQLNSK